MADLTRAFRIVTQMEGWVAIYEVWFDADGAVERVVEPPVIQAPTVDALADELIEIAGALRGRRYKAQGRRLVPA